MRLFASPIRGGFIRRKHTSSKMYYLSRKSAQIESMHIVDAPTILLSYQTNSDCIRIQGEHLDIVHNVYTICCVVDEKKMKGASDVVAKMPWVN